MIASSLYYPHLEKNEQFQVYELERTPLEIPETLNMTLSTKQIKETGGISLLSIVIQHRLFYKLQGLDESNTQQANNKTAKTKKKKKKEKTDKNGKKRVIKIQNEYLLFLFAPFSRTHYPLPGLRDQVLGFFRFLKQQKWNKK